MHLLSLTPLAPIIISVMMCICSALLPLAPHHHQCGGMCICSALTVCLLIKPTCQAHSNYKCFSTTTKDQNAIINYCSHFAHETFMKCASCFQLCVVALGGASCALLFSHFCCLSSSSCIQRLGRMNVEFENTCIQISSSLDNTSALTLNSAASTSQSAYTHIITCVLHS